MSTENEIFTTARVDEQIEEFVHAHTALTQQSSPSMNVVHNLYDIYEDVNSPVQMNRSLDRIWERLAEHISTTSMPVEASTHIIPLRPPEEMQPPLPPSLSARQRSWRRALAMSIAVAVVIVNILGWTVLTQRLHQSSTPEHHGTPTVAVHTTQASSLKERAYQLLHAFQQEVTSWGQAHQYYDAFNGKSYPLDYAYAQQGIGQDAQIAVQNARTSADYQAAIALISNDLANLRAMQADYSDKTPWNQVHSTDMQLMQRYHLSSGRVIVVSLIEQSLRLYQDGKLEKAFLITSGRVERPTPPGLSQIFYRVSPTILKSTEPQRSPYWYPPTPVNYALEFHTGSYFIHDSWWRVNYGPGTQFPHHDSGGDQSFSGNGSMGTINMTENDAAWLYSHTSNGDMVLIY